jgi:hypothetical protein
MVNVSTAGHWLKKQVVSEVQKWLSDAEQNFNRQQKYLLSFPNGVKLLTEKQIMYNSNNN